MLRRFAWTTAALALAAPIAYAQPAQPAPAPPIPVVQPVQTPPPAPLPAPVPTPAHPARGPKPPTPPPAPPPPPRGQPINVQVEVVITDHRGTATATKKTVTLVVADQRSGMIRSDALVPNVPGAGVPLSIDANPEILPDGKLRLGFSLSYDLPREGFDQGTTLQPARMSLRENVNMILENGKSMLVTQSADPVGDRQVTVEVKATILK